MKKKKKEKSKSKSIAGKTIKQELKKTKNK